MREGGRGGKTISSFPWSVRYPAPILLFPPSLRTSSRSSSIMVSASLRGCEGTQGWKMHLPMEPSAWREEGRDREKGKRGVSFKFRDACRGREERREGRRHAYRQRTSW